MPLHLVAEFCKDDGEDETKYRSTVYRFAFLGTPEQIAAIKERVDNEEASDLFEQIEDEFGTVDQGYSGDEMCGFSSNEIEPEHYEEVIQKCRDFFSNNFGATLGPNEITVTDETYD